MGVPRNRWTDIMTHTLTTLPVEFNLLARLSRLVEGFRAKRAQRLAFNQAYTDLQFLSDRELMEFGLHRSDLCELARVEAYKD